MNTLPDVYRGADGRQALVQIEQSAAPARRADDRLDLRALITAFRRRLRLFLAVLLTVMVLVMALTLRQTPIYVAQAQVVLNMREENVAPTAKQAPTSLPTSDRASTEVEVIRSRDMAGAVVDALHLQDDPRFNPLLRPAGGPMATLRGLLGQPEPPPLQLPAATVRNLMIDLLRGSLTVTRVAETYALSIAVATTAPDNAARIANEFARQYTQGQLQEKQGENQSAVHFLAGRLEELRRQAQIDTERVQQYRIAHNLLSTSGASLTEQEISTYNQSVATARAAAAEDRARLTTALAQLRSGSSGDDVGEALGSSVVGGLRARQAEVSGRLATLEARYGSRHPDVLRTRSELDDVNRQIQAEIKRVISNLEAKTRVSDQRLASITESLSSARGTLTQNNRAMVGLDDLTRRATASQELYESYMARYKEEAAQGGTERADARVISPAVPPRYPTSPRPLLSLFLALVFGSALGLGAAFLAEMLFSGFTTGDDVETKLDLRYLGGVPALGSVLPKARSAIDAVVQEPMSGFAEAFRNLRTSLHYAGGGQARVVAITSALPKEGKTTTAICLARTIALGGERVVLVDCDARQRGISRMFREADDRPGLIEVLRGTATLDDALLLDVPSGAWSLRMARAEREIGDLLTGEAMSELLAELRRRFDHVLLDTAPVLPIADTRALTTLADQVLFVARWRSTPDHAVKAALRLLPLNYVRIAGVALSRVDMRKQGKFGHGDASYYYSQYADYYG